MALFSVADIFTAIFLLIAVVGAVQRNDGRKSTKALIVTMIVSIVMVLLDSLSGFVYPASTPNVLLYITVVFSALATKGIQMAFYYYCYQYFREKTDISKWLFIVPMMLLALTMMVHARMVFTLDEVTLNNGAIVVNGSMRPIIKLASVVLPLYPPVLAIIKRKKVGTSTVLFAGAPAIVGILISFIGLHDYGTSSAALIIFTTYVLLQNGIYNQREREQHLLEASKAELESLNAQLEEKQERLEESTSEQEAQIEEITALNARLQDNQAELEASAAEQEAQIAEISELNSQLQEAKEAAEKHSEALNEQLDIIGSLAVTYESLYYIDMLTLNFIELGKSDVHIEEIIKREGNAVLAMEMMCAHIVAADQADDMRKFSELSTLNERLRERTWISKQFQSVTGRWNEGIFIAAKRDDNGNCLNAIWAVRTINDMKLREIAYQKGLEEARDQAEAANAAKTTFLFNMSHDIRTPMNAIMGFRDLLEKHQDDSEKRQDYLNKIQDASTVLLSIINNVLEMARIEKGTLEIDETAWSTEQFNDTLYSVFHVMMEEKGLKFTRQIEVQHHYVYCDPTKLREIFINILSNAYKYTNAGGSVNMHLEEIPSDREGWVLYQTTISDTGIGMSEEFLPHIFEEFSREQNTTDAKIEGTGLGMPIVKRLVEMLDGTIEVKSKKGVGSAFIVTIPHKIAERSTLVLHAGVEIDPKLFEGKRILLAEDNDLNAEIAEEILGEVGFIVERAEDGAICVDKLKSARDGYYDLILMDIQMPNMNGYEATRAIRQLDDSHKSNIKIIAMTANAFEEDKREALRAGMNDHVAKPINVNVLMRTLAGMMG